MDGNHRDGGQMVPGTYSFRQESFQSGKIIANDKVEVFNKVTEVRQGEAGAVLALESGATVLPSEVKALRPLHTP